MQAQRTRPNPKKEEAVPITARETDNSDYEVASRKSLVARIGYMSISLLMIAAVRVCDAYKQQPWYGFAVGLICCVAAVAYIGLTIFLVVTGKPRPRQETG